MAEVTTQRTTRAWMYREQLREILNRKQVNVVRTMLQQGCTHIARPKVEPMKAVARLIRSRLESRIAWAQTQATNDFPEVLNGFFQAAQRKDSGYGRFSTLRTVIFLIAGKPDFSGINPHEIQQSHEGTRSVRNFLHQANGSHVVNLTQIRHETDTQDL